VTVTDDGTIQLPGIGSVPALGLSLTEVSAEANARYAREVQGLEVTAILNTRAPRFVFVLGEVVTPGRVTLDGPTTVIQAISQVQGWRPGANLRHVVVMRRDKNWQLVATRLDLSGPLWGQRPNPSDDLWLRHSDIVIIPKNPGQRLADFIEVYFTRGLYGVFPTQGFAVGFNGVSRL
jgi:polysaccharide export outer membrane protein